MFLAIALVAWVVTQAISNAKLDHTYAKQGMVSPRLQAKYGDGAAAKTARYGMADFLGDAWSDYWQGRAEALKADREARVAQPRVRVPWSERWQRATVTATKVGRWLVTPVGEAPAGEASAPAPQQPTAPARPATPVAPSTPPLQTEPTTQPTSPNPAGDPAPTDPSRNSSAGGATMSAPTGEAVNYETTVAELEALERVQQEHVDQCAAAVKAADDLASAVDGMQQTYRQASGAAALMSEHLAAKNLDSTTLANAGTVVDAMPDGVVAEWFDRIEQVQSAARERLAAAEVALAATSANLAHVQATYGDAHATVAGNLSGDASFLDAGGGVTRNGGFGSVAGTDRGRPAAPAPGQATNVGGATSGGTNN